MEKGLKTDTITVGKVGKTVRVAVQQGNAPIDTVVPKILVSIKSTGYKHELIIVGTSHVAKTAVEQVKRIIQEKRPVIVAIELDKDRLVGLLHPEQKTSSWETLKAVGLRGFLFAAVAGWVQRKIGSSMGLVPGADMLEAYKAAQVVGARVALIDQHIQVTLRKISVRLTWLEKWHFFIDVLKALFHLQPNVSFDLSSVPDKDIIHALMSEFKKRYPTLYDVLVVERNNYMAAHLVRLVTHSDGLVIAVVGAGHEEDLRRLFDSMVEKIDFHG